MSLDPRPLALDLPAALDHFRAEGYARLGRLLSPEGLGLLQGRLDAMMQGEITYPGLFFQMDSPTGRYEDLRRGQGWEGPSLDYRKLEKLERDPLFRAWLENPVFEQIARALLGEAISLCRAVAFHKPSRGGSPLPWHQDGGYFWGLDRNPILQIWTALDDATRDGGCLEVLPRSHLAGLATPMGGVVPAPHLDRERADERALALPAQAGEVILLHNHLWHRSGSSQTGQRRRAFTVCYMDAATRCTRKKKAPREFVRLFTGATRAEKIA